MPRAGQKRGGAPPKNPRRRGAPDPASVVAEIPFTSPSGETFTILRTDEMDAYDPPPAEVKPETKPGKKAKPAGRRRRRG